MIGGFFSLLLLLRSLAPLIARGEEPPPPLRRVFLVGESGAGKSSFGNRLLRWDATHRRTPPFEVGSGFEAVTQHIRCVEGWSVGARRLEVCDTPGLNDPGRADADTARQIVSALRPSDGLVYVHNAQQMRLTKAARKAMKLLLRESSESLADRVLFVFSRATSLSSLSRRALADILCSKLDASFCHKPPALAFAGVHNRFLDLATFVDPRLRRALVSFLDGLRSANGTLDDDRNATMGRPVVVVDNDEDASPSGTCSDVCAHCALCHSAASSSSSAAEGEDSSPRSRQQQQQQQQQHHHRSRAAGEQHQLPFLRSEDAYAFLAGRTSAATASH